MTKCENLRRAFPFGCARGKSVDNHAHKKMRMYIYPDGRGYFSVALVSLFFVWFSLQALYCWFNSAENVELVKIAVIGVLFMLIRSSFPEAFYVVIGQRALFCYTYDAIWAVRIKSCSSLYDCLEICPVTNYTKSMFSHMRLNDFSAWRWVRCTFFVEVLLVLVASWLYVFSLMIRCIHSRTLTCSMVLVIISTSFASAIWVVCVCVRKSEFSFLWWRKIVRVPDDEAMRRLLFKSVFRSAPYKEIGRSSVKS